MNLKRGKLEKVQHFLPVEREKKAFNKLAPAEPSIFVPIISPTQVTRPWQKHLRCEHS